MTDGQIWAVMIKLKVFTPQILLERLGPPPYLKNFIKEKIRNLIAQQLKNHILRLLVENPPVFCTEDATPEDIESFKRTCGICGKRFFPVQKQQRFCSVECKREHYKQYHRQRRKKLGMRLDSRRRWTEEEIKMARELRRQGKTYREIANILGRTTNAVKDKLKRLEVKA